MHVHMLVINMEHDPDICRVNFLSHGKLSVVTKATLAYLDLMMP